MSSPFSFKATQKGKGQIVNRNVKKGKGQIASGSVNKGRGQLFPGSNNPTITPTNTSNSTTTTDTPLSNNTTSQNTQQTVYTTKDRGQTGPAGKSAYQVWLDAGNIGSVEVFLNSLIGQTGQTGTPGSDSTVPGPTPNLTIGNVTQLDPDSTPTVTIDTTDPKNPILNFGLADGADGEVGTQGVSVNNVDVTKTTNGLIHTYELTFGLSNGSSLSPFSLIVTDGATGNTGAASTVPGPANTLSIGTVTSGTTPSATITGVSPNQTLNLVLKKGDAGDDGTDGTDGADGKSVTSIIKKTQTEYDNDGKSIVTMESTIGANTKSDFTFLLEKGDDSTVPGPDGATGNGISSLTTTQTPYTNGESLVTFRTNFTNGGYDDDVITLKQGEDGTPGSVNIATNGATGSNTQTIKFTSGPFEGYSFVISRPTGDPSLSAKLYNGSIVVNSVSKSIFDSFTLTATTLRLTAGTTNSEFFPFESLTNVTSGAGIVGTISGNTVDIALTTFSQGTTYSGNGIVKIENKPSQSLTASKSATVSRFTPQFKGITSSAPTTFANLQNLTQTGAWNGSVTTQTGDFAFTTPTLFTKAIVDGVTETFFATPNTITQNDYQGNPVTMYSYFLDDTVAATLTNFS